MNQGPPGHPRTESESSGEILSSGELPRYWEEQATSEFAAKSSRRQARIIDNSASKLGGRIARYVRNASTLPVQLTTYSFHWQDIHTAVGIDDSGMWRISGS